MARRKKPIKWSTGHRRSNLVNVRSRGGLFVLEWFERTETGALRRERRSLKHRDLDRAKEQAKDKAQELRANPSVSHTSTDDPLTLGLLLARYLAEESPRKGKSVRQQNSAAFLLFKQCWGEDKSPAALSVTDWNKYIDARKSGALHPPKGRPSGVGPRQIELELTRLMTVLNWATTAKGPDERALLSHNPCKGLERPKELNPQRPMLDGTQYSELLKAAANVDRRLVLALALCDDTGHRLNSVRQLRWEDVDYDREAITWQPGGDKSKTRHETPLPLKAAKRLRLEQEVQGSPATGLIFPAARNAEVALERGIFYKWLHQAKGELKASGKVALPPRAGFHCMRRKMASELSLQPLAVVASLGGWLNPDVVVSVYQRPSLEQMRHVLKHRGQLTK